ncbi:hypothetical protein ABDK00_004975 [Niabella insulamsoli]|uniref:hypothetical protein n=1 Tax=Niabella insulamsoli TaxID=3144874 RepID=UPI0031FDC3DF
MKKLLPLLLIAFVSVSALMSCSKDDVDGETGSRFKPSDFKISNIKATQRAGSSTLSISFDQTNTTDMNYTYDSDGSFRIKWTVNSTDGNTYNEDRLLATVLDAKATSAETGTIQLSPGKIADISTLKYEVYYNY